MWYINFTVAAKAQKGTMGKSVVFFPPHFLGKKSCFDWTKIITSGHCVLHLFFSTLILTVWLQLTNQHDTTLHVTDKIKLIQAMTPYPQLYNPVSVLRKPTSQQAKRKPKGSWDIFCFCSLFNRMKRKFSAFTEALKEVHSRNCWSPLRGCDCKCWGVCPCVWLTVNGVTAPTTRCSLSMLPLQSQAPPGIPLSSHPHPAHCQQLLATCILEAPGCFKTENFLWTVVLSWKNYTFSIKKILPICMDSHIPWMG